MALTTVTSVRQVSGINNVVSISDAWLPQLVAAADKAIKRYCKQNIELANYGGSTATTGMLIGDSGYYNGNLETQLVLRQKWSWSGTTTVAAPSNGLALPQSTINVASTVGFNPNGGTFAVQTSVTTFAAVTYTGTTATSFTGCAGGTGTLNNAAKYNAVGSPVVFVNANGYWGTNPQGFPTNVNPLVPGVQCGLFVDGTDPSGAPISNRSLLTRLCGGGGYLSGYFPQPYMGGGKLAAYSGSVWEHGQGNVQVIYSAGFSTVPDDLQYAANMLVANMIRMQPKGTDLASEGLGSYSYSVLQRSLNAPELGSLSNTLSLYRDVSL